MIGLDHDETLIAAQGERAAGLPVTPLLADARGFELPEPVALALAPMQLLQMLADRAERLACLDSIAAWLLPGGRVAAAMVEGMPEPEEGEPPPFPTCARSTAGSIRACRSKRWSARTTSIVHRLRQRVSPSGELTDFPDQVTICTLTADELEAEAAEVGLVPIERLYIDPTADHVGSTVVVLGEEARWSSASSSLYPEQMNIYADRGNILFLQRRCEWRGIDFAWEGAGPGESVDPAGHDLFYIGGGQDRDQRAVAADMVETKRAALAAAVEDGAALLAVCGGYQLLGESYQLGEETLPGLGLADLRTVREEGPRLIGNVAIETELGGARRLLAGFENHGGRTYLGATARPLGRVVKGHGYGNNGGDGLEGVWREEHGRHLPPRPPAPQERLAGRPPDRTGLGAALRQPVPSSTPCPTSWSDAAEASARTAAGV